MAPTLYTLQLEPYDDVVSIRDRLSFVQASHVLLMCPPGTPVLRRKLDLLLVQRQPALRRDGGSHPASNWRSRLL